MWDHVDASDAIATVVAQIEDPEALDVIDEIASVGGIHALFIGRGDLSVAMGAKGPDAPEVRAAAEKIAAAGRKAKKPVMVFSGGLADAQAMRKIGASAFVILSDQGLMRQAAAKMLADLGGLE
jgi:2-keto-3-deoxy-L-rhamnonate aldolase RhmA